MAYPCYSPPYLSKDKSWNMCCLQMWKANIGSWELTKGPQISHLDKLIGSNQNTGKVQKSPENPFMMFHIDSAIFHEFTLNL